MTSLVFVPLDRAEVTALRAGADIGPRPGCAPTAALADSLEPDAVAEEVDFAALSHAGVLALSAGSEPLRLILAADVSDQQLTGRGGDFGEVTVTGLRWAQVRALFADEPAAGSSVARARAEMAGLGLADGFATDAVAALQGDFDLLWFAPDELDRLVDDQH
jgi:hypothetical protein